MSSKQPDIYAPCTVCNTIYPLDELSERTMICPECIARDTAAVHNAKARSKAKEAFKEIIRSSRADRIEAPHISEVCATMIKELGGLHKFCADLVEDYMDARERSPGSSTLLRFGVDIFRLARDSSALRDTAPDAVNMTDEELAGEVLAMVDQAARRRRLEHAEGGLLDVLLEDAHAQLRGRTDEGTDGATSGGGESPPAGSPEVLPSD